MLMANLYIQLSELFPVKEIATTSKWRPVWTFWNIKLNLNLTTDMRKSSQIMPNFIFHGDDVIDYV